MANSAIITPSSVLRLVPKSGTNSALFDMIRDYTAARSIECSARLEFEHVVRKSGKKSAITDDIFRDAMRRLDRAKDDKVAKARSLFDYIEATF